MRPGLQKRAPKVCLSFGKKTEPRHRSRRRVNWELSHERSSDRNWRWPGPSPNPCKVRTPDRGRQASGVGRDYRRPSLRRNPRCGASAKPQPPASSSRCWWARRPGSRRWRRSSISTSRGSGIVDAPHSAASAAKAVELIHEAKGELLMKGSLHTDELMRSVTAKATGLRTDRRISHVFAIDVPGYADTLFITDAAINIFPTRRQTGHRAKRDRFGGSAGRAQGRDIVGG